MTQSTKTQQEPIETVKKVLFKHFIEGKTAIQSHQEVHPNTTYNSAANQGAMTVKNPQNREWLMKQLEEGNIGIKAKNALTAVLDGKKSHNIDLFARARGVDLAAKIFGWYAPKVSQQQSLSMKVNMLSDDQLLGRIEEIKKNIENKMLLGTQKGA